MSMFAARCDALRRLVAKKSLAALLVTDERNVTYLSGFTGDSSYLLLTPASELLITDGRYTQQLQEECPGLELAVRGPGSIVSDFTCQTLAGMGLPSLGIEADVMTIGFFEQLGEALKSATLAQTSGLVESLREIK